MMLLSLPDEALVCLFSFIEGRELIISVSLVCKRFRCMISSEWYWKRRFRLACCGKEMVKIGDHVNQHITGLQLTCIESEQVRIACNDKMGFMGTESMHASSGGIDCVQLLYPNSNRTEVVVVGGCRDHLIYLWKKRSRNEIGGARSMRQYINSELRGHVGWVWCLSSHASNQDILASGSWDHDVRLWDIMNGQCVRHFRKMHRAAVLSLSFLEPQLLLSGGFDKKVKMFDIRDKNAVGKDIGSHIKAVLTVQCAGNMVYTGSDDRTVRLWDVRRPDEEIVKVKCSSSVTSICLNHQVLSVACGTTVQLYNVSQGQLELKDEFDSGHAMPLTSVYHNLGMVVTASKDHYAHIHTMTLPHTCLKKFKHQADVTDIHYGRGILALGSSDKSVSLWLPNRL